MVSLAFKTEELDEQRTSRWGKKGRYYMIELKQDLFGKWILVKTWGSKNSMRGGSMTQPIDFYAQGIDLFSKAILRRMKRGYQEVKEH